ncbi:ABC transporter permease [Microbacterium xanthum]|uniref:ABC transporter permease n=1 Tax=Microbacterium xanthum TaxID=3079794 RepID=UPI002AD2D876|nr:MULTISPECIES: iron chelate uptake ABC transporter family permease subunit [unclassified Microbacterium]MDZ8172247.1 iron chelate uptake ABC transporter family permease subunit [Microbacterium sp. KSW-48]MDZ8202035.1 iron chelate uptake ABC transporter family permease subunit [Microbacterium sp. SSW1-59]
MTSTPPAPRITLVDALSHTADARRHARQSRWRRTWPLLIAIVLTIGLVIVSIFTGVADITDMEGRGHEFLWITRIPRTVALVLAGASMAMAGLVMQLMTQNRFVEPTTVGTTEWAGLGLLLTYIFLPGSGLFAKIIVAIVFAFAGTLVFFAFLRRVTLKSSLIVPIIGIMLGAVVGAVSTFLALEFNLLQTLGGWFMGRFTGIEVGRYEPLWIVLFVAIAVVIVADRFTVAGLGKDIATNVGLNYERVVLLGVALVALTTGTVTVIVGALPFLGLIVPNLVSVIRGDDLRSNLPWVFLTGIWIVTVCDLIGRTIIMPFEVPISLVLGVVGAVVFIAMLLRTRRSNVR